MDLHAWITQQVDRVEQLLGENEWPLSQAEGVRLRCEADRRILARHRLDPDVTYEPACEGCGTYGDLELSNVDNLNDCPELLDLAHAHGLTDEALAGLDRPQPPPRPERKASQREPLVPPDVTAAWADATLSFWLTGTMRSRTAMKDVPEALRGPHWKP